MFFLTLTRSRRRPDQLADYMRRTMALLTCFVRHEMTSTKLLSSSRLVSHELITWVDRASPIDHFLSQQDLSTNGILHNGSRPQNRSMFLRNGDIIQIPTVDKSRYAVSSRCIKLVSFPELMHTALASRRVYLSRPFPRTTYYSHSAARSEIGCAGGLHHSQRFQNLSEPSGQWQFWGSQTGVRPQSGKFKSYVAFYSTALMAYS